VKVAAERIPGSQVVLSIEVEAEELEQGLEQAYRRLVTRTAVPGFRKGKAPRPILERFLGQEGLRQEALERLLPELLSRAVEEQELEPIAQPELEITQMEPVAFKATVTVRPEVELGNYREIRIPLEPVEVKEEEVDSTLERLRYINAPWEPVERPTQAGDLLSLDVAGSVDGKTVIDRKGEAYQLDLNSSLPAPGFAQQLEGMEWGGEKQFVLVLPPELGELGGKECEFKVVVSEIKEKRLPELDDEFAKSLGRGEETLESLRANLVQELKTQAERQAKNSLGERAVEAVVNMVKLELPRVLVEQEIDRLLSRKREQRQLGPEEYLSQMKKSEEELRAELSPEAEANVTRSLVLAEIARVEGITVSQEDVDAEVERLVQGAGESGAALRGLFSSVAARGSIELTLLTRKTAERLVEIAAGEIQAEEETEEKAEL